ncbi:MAG: hypothetical protein JWO38_1939, partial [Gemmataceae bacterium]|nr:hypothetical protein [Gemmataceae bacterium]
MMARSVGPSYKGPGGGADPNV